MRETDHARGLTPPGLVERLKRAFFRSFFALLIGWVAAGEWLCAAWILFVLGWRVPLVVHVVAPLAIFVLNRRLITRRSRARRSRWMRAYTAIAFTCIFCALLLVASGILWAAGAGAATLVGWLAPGSLPAGAGFARAYVWAVTAALAVVAGIFLYGYTLGARALAITHLKVPVPGLAPALAGFRIVHITDLHIGLHLDRRELEEHVRRVNALSPDLICVTGDLVDRIDGCAGFTTLAGLKARHGVLVTLGNHDFYAGADRVTAALRHLTPFTVLRNARADVKRDGGTLAVLGIDDLGRDWARGVGEHPALAPLVASVPRGAPFVVLSHRPDCFPQAAQLGASLVLAGHTHGGQLAWPRRNGHRVPNLAQFITAFDRGVYRQGSSMLYVNRGLGFTGQKIRLFTPREIACIELTPE